MTSHSKTLSWSYGRGYCKSGKGQWIFILSFGPCRKIIDTVVTHVYDDTVELGLYGCQGFTPVSILSGFSESPKTKADIFMATKQNCNKFKLEKPYAHLS